MQTVTVHTSQNIDIDYEVASLGDRILARLIDILFFIALAIVFIIVGFVLSWPKVATITLGIIYLLTYACYDLVSEVFFNGQCIGKYYMKIKVVSLNGARPNTSQYFLRWLFRIVDFGITYDVCALISVAVSYRKQRVGDIVAGTTLIKTIPRTQINSLVFEPVEIADYVPIFPDVINLTDKNIALIREVIDSYKKTGNTELVYNMANRVKEHLNITPPKHMEYLLFLQTIIKDYTYITSAIDS